MSSFALKWGKESYQVTIDSTTTPASLMTQVESLTGVPVANQKLMAKKGWRAVMSGRRCSISYISTLTDIKVPASSADLILVHTSTHVTTPTSFESQNCGNKVHSSVRACLGGYRSSTSKKIEKEILYYSHLYHQQCFVLYLFVYFAWLQQLCMV